MTTTTTDRPAPSRTLWQRLARSLTQHDSFGAYFEPLIQLALPMWSTNGYRTKVLEVRTELPDVYSLVLKPGRGWGGFHAGQFVQIVAEQNGVLCSRYFSISSSPDHYARTGLIELTIRVQDKGRITPWLRHHFADGGWVRISAAQGDFVLPQSDEPVLLLAGGSGITPFRSMLNQLRAQNDNRDVQLLYFARDARHFLFQDEFNRLQLDNPQLNITLLDNEQHGLISAELLQQYCPDFARRQILICGPAPMIALSRNILTDLQVPQQNIGFEYFGAAPIDQPRSSSDAALVAFRQSGINVDIAAGESARSLLEVAENAGLKPVSGCRVGVCHQCICQKQSGVVYNTRTGQYSDTGAGEIQLCISVAASDLVLDL